MIFDGRVAIVTGAGRGLGREHALLLASEGAAVVVNDLGGATDGSGSDMTPAQSVVAEIVDNGGRAVVNTDDVSDWEGAGRLVSQAVSEFGRLDVLINNAGVLRDRMLVNLSEDEWDVVMRVNAKGHAAPLRHAAAYWRQQAKAGEKVAASVVNTTSPSALFANVGQTNYAAAKMAVAGLTMVPPRSWRRMGYGST
jgi:NAD(P)-dependent dehydrogenase (short-subunit alcohol dehydrogenase family)